MFLAVQRRREKQSGECGGGAVKKSNLFSRSVAFFLNFDEFIFAIELSITNFAEFNGSFRGIYFRDWGTTSRKYLPRKFLPLRYLLSKHYHSKYCFLRAECRTFEHLWDTAHEVRVCVSRSNHTTKGDYCLCMTGMSATCNYVVALLLRVEEAVRHAWNEFILYNWIYEWLPKKLLQ